MARGRPKGVKNRPRHIIDAEKAEKARIRAERIANGEVIKRGRKPGTKNRPKEVIQAEREARTQLQQEKKAARLIAKNDNTKPIPEVIPVNTIFVLKTEVRNKGMNNARRLVVTGSSPWLIEFFTENGKSHVTMPENIIVVGKKEEENAGV